MDRNKLIRMAEETQEILSLGAYEVDGESYLIEEDLRFCKMNSVLETPQEYSPASAPSIEVRNCATLDVARDGIVLNFASGRRPGGGWLSGGNAQEESLVRSSGLSLCLDHPQFYEQRSPAYSDYLIYSPNVPVIRSSDGNLCAPHRVSFITYAAPNASSGYESWMEATMHRRIAGVLARAKGHKKLVLGAWGCGVFKQDPVTVAKIFRRHLVERKGYSGYVVFAILDKNMADIFRSILCE